jgi:protein Mpv17
MSIRLLSQSVGKLLSKKFARPSTVPFQRFSSMVHVPFRHQLNRVNDLVQRRPVLTSIVVTGVKAWAADLMIQKLVEKRETVDLKRSALFASFGSAYQGCIQYWIYNILFEKRLFPGKSPQMILMKIAATNLIVDPVIFFPIFYTMREAMNTERLLDVNLPHCFSTSMAKYRDNCVSDLINSWMIWVPAHCVTYTVVPVHLRMPWIAVVSFGYVCVLSFTRGEAGK